MRLLRVARATVAAMAVLLPALALVIAPSARAADPVDTDTLDAIRAYIGRELDALNVPGAAVSIVRDDEIVFAEGYGRADESGRAVTPDTPFDLASVSKSFTAIAVLQQVEAGTLELDAPVREYLAWFGEHQPALADVTVRDLLGHQSGWTLGDGQANLADEYDGPDAIERNVRRLAATAPTNPRGTFEYSNANYDTLALLVQEVSGTELGEYLETRVFDPLGMGHAHATRAAADTDGLAQGFYPFMGIPIAYDVPYVPGGAGSGFLYASAEDLARALILHLNEGRVGDTQVLAPEFVTTLHRAIGHPDPASGYGGGLWTFPLWGAGELRSDIEPPSYEVPIVFEHEGDHATTATSILFLPAEGWGVVVLLNVNDSAATSRYHQMQFGIANILLGLDPPETVAYEDVIGQNVRAIVAGTVLVQILGVAWAFRRLRRWHRDPSSRPRGRAALTAHLVPALVFDIAVTAFFLWLLLDRADAPVAVVVRYAPDIALGIALITLLGLGWGLVRTVLSLRTLRTAASDP